MLEQVRAEDPVERCCFERQLPAVRSERGRRRTVGAGELVERKVHACNGGAARPQGRRVVPGSTAEVEHVLPLEPEGKGVNGPSGERLVKRLGFGLLREEESKEIDTG